MRPVTFEIEVSVVPQPG